MDKTILVKDDILEGRMLIEHLERTDFKVNSALWFYISYSSKWKLVLATDYLKEHRLKEAYNFIQEELNKIKSANISLDNIRLAKADDDLIKLLKAAIGAGPGISEIRFTRKVINGIMIEDALIYRIT